MGDGLAQAALILVHLNLFSSTANWDLRLGRRTPLCVWACFFFFPPCVIPRVAGGHVSHFWPCSLTSGFKKQAKQGWQRTTSNLHNKTQRVLMMNSKGDEVVARFKAERRQQCLNLTPVDGWAEKEEERLPLWYLPRRMSSYNYVVNRPMGLIHLCAFDLLQKPHQNTDVVTFKNRRAVPGSVGPHYLSRSVSLRVPWGTRICSLPRAAPDTWRTDGTCWARMDRGHQHKSVLEAHSRQYLEHVQPLLFFDSIQRSLCVCVWRGVLRNFLCNRGYFQIEVGDIKHPY